MQRLQYRNQGDHETLVGTWTVDTLASPGNHAAPRWFELRHTSGPWTLYQQGTQSPDTAHRWMGSIGMDAAGDIALGYSVVDAPNTLYPSLRYATRAPGDALGVLQSEATLVTGTEGCTTSTSGAAATLDTAANSSMR